MTATRTRLLIALAGIVAAAALVIAVLVALGAPGAPTRSERVVRSPPGNAGFDYQIGGPYPPASGAAVVVRDWEVDPAEGRYNVCYVNIFETQAADESWWKDQHPDLVLQRNGAPVEDPNWPRQYIIDTSTAAKRSALAAIQRPWLRSCADKGYDAVEFDNLDSWYRSFGALTPSDNLALARTLVRDAHGLGMAVAQKNGAVLRGDGKRVAGFDFAIAESCEVYDECDSYTDAYGDLVFEIEYTDEPGDPFQRACAARGDRLAIIQRDRLVVPQGQPDYRYAAC